MSGPNAPNPWTAREWGCLVAVVVVVVASLWLRWPGFTQGGFASHDVAGILYNAMVLDRGGLPYVDTVELKAPGAFYLAWGLAGPEGRDIARFEVWANAWAVAALVAVAATAWRWFGPRCAVAAAVLYGLLDAHLDSMDANYVTWANLPAVLAASVGLAALQRRRTAAGSATKASRRADVGTLGLWVLAGLLAGAAALCKRPGGIMLPVLLGWAVLDAAPPRRRGLAALGVVVGFGSAMVPVWAHFAALGHGGEFWRGYVLNRWGAAYVGRGGAVALGPLAQAGEGLFATTYFLAPALMAAAFGLGRAPRTVWRQLWPLAWWAALTLVSAWVGLRFYKGYFLIAAAPLAVLASLPGGLWDPRWRDAVGSSRPRGERALRVGLCVLLVGLGLRQAALLGAMRADRARAHDRGGRIIAAHVLAHSEPDDQVWVWGWHLWDVYPLTGQMSGSRIYKSIGLLTPPNDDTWRRPTTPPRFVDGPAAAMLVEDLRRARPRYVVFGSTVPWRDFAQLRALLREDYRVDRRVQLGRVRFYRRLDPPPDQPGPPAPRWTPGQHDATVTPPR